MNSGQKETIIRISDLGGAILRAIKPILAVVLVFALLGAAYGARRAMKSAAGEKVSGTELSAAAQTAYETKQLVLDAEVILSTLQDISIPNAEESLRLNEQLLQGWQEYVDNSVYYSLDPFHCPVSRVTLLFTDREPGAQDVLITNTVSEVAMNVNGRDSVVQQSTIDADSQPTSDEAAFVKSVVSDSAVIEEIRGIMGVDLEPVYVGELLRVKALSDRIVELTVCAEDVETARQVSDHLVAALEESLAGEDSAFTVSVISRFDGVDVDWEMVDDHKSSTEDYNLTRSDYVLAQQTLSRLHEAEETTQNLVDARRVLAADSEKSLQKILDRETKSSLSLKSLLKRAVRFGVVFFLVGAVLSCGLVFLSMILSGRVKNVNDVITRYPFPVIGILPKKKKRWFEKSIRRLEGEPEFDHDTAGRAITQSLLSLAGDRRIALVSSEDVGLLRELTEYTGDRIPVCGNLLKDADAVKAAAQYDGFVLVEAKDKSRYDLINAEISRIKMLDRKVEGIILL